jgi:hypothetical protein
MASGGAADAGSRSAHTPSPTTSAADEAPHAATRRLHPHRRSVDHRWRGLPLLDGDAHPDRAALGVVVRGARAGVEGAPARGEDVLQGSHELLHGLESLLRIALDAAREPRVEAGGDGAVLGGDGERLGADEHDQLTGDVSLERTTPDHALVGDHRHRPEVAPAIERLATARLLRAHVMRRPEDRAGLGLDLVGGSRRVDQLGDAEIEDLHQGLRAAVSSEEHVVGLEIAVDDARLMRAGHRAAHPGEDLRDLLEGELRRAPQTRAERLSLEELHHDEGGVLLHAVVDDLHHVGAAKRRGGARLAQEPRPLRVALGETRIEQLDRDRGAQTELLSAPHRPHAPLSDEGEDSIAGVEDLAGRPQGRRVYTVPPADEGTSTFRGPDGVQPAR